MVDTAILKRNQWLTLPSLSDLLAVIKERINLVLRSLPQAIWA
jgi:hypothetical protein